MSRLARLVALACVASACARSDFNRDEAARICSTLQVCNPGEFYRFGGDLPRCTTMRWVYPWPGSLKTSPAIEDGMEGPLRDIFACLLGARGDCEKAARCWTQVEGPATCSTWGLLGGTCEGSVLSGCNTAGQPFAIDCAAYGEVCGKKDIYIADIAACGVAACPSPGTPLRCRGTRAEICQGELLGLADCARLGLRCEAPSDGGNAACVGGVSCDVTSDSATCEGAVAITCTEEGQRVRVDCAASPRNKRCHLGQCVPTGTECDGQVECEGAVLAYCQDGFAHRFDCAAEGFGPCSSGACTAP
jgi:hypothetical protein